jgi:hypothetical protein
MSFYVMLGKVSTGRVSLDQVKPGYARLGLVRSGGTGYFMLGHVRSIYSRLDQVRSCYVMLGLIWPLRTF